jgi:AcrR family transcriptional regulator
VRTLSGDRLLGKYHNNWTVMTRTSQRGNTARQSSRPRNPARAVHQKGQETRERILDAALKAFGEASFLAVTTRQIAQAASVSLPTLQYYFGHKEGLYRACAETIVERYRSHTKLRAKRLGFNSKHCSPPSVASWSAPRRPAAGPRFWPGNCATRARHSKFCIRACGGRASKSQPA